MRDEAQDEVVRLQDEVTRLLESHHAMLYALKQERGRLAEGVLALDRVYTEAGQRILGGNYYEKLKKEGQR